MNDLLLSELTAISPVDGRYSNKTKLLRGVTSEFALLRYRLHVEIEWFIQLAKESSFKELPTCSKADIDFLRTLYQSFSIDDAKQIKTIEQTTQHDVKAVEYFLKEKIKTLDTLAPYIEFIHFGCTSEDINNLAYGLMLTDIRNNFLQPQLKTLIKQLADQAETYAALPMLSRTHGQPATPTTLGKEFANIAYRLQNALKQLLSTNITGKCNGAVGNFNAHDITYPEIDWPAVSKQFIESLGLTYHPYTTQIEPHDTIATLCTDLANLNTILIDASRDFWGYISLNYFHQQSEKNAVGSSTMPHKINPIDFENAEGNLGIANSLLFHFAQKLPIARWQRDLSDSTVLRNLGSAFAYALIAFQSLEKGLSKLTPNKEAIEHDLNQHPEVISEAIQTIMRRYQLPEPYEQLKALTKGKKLSLEELHNWIKTLDLPEAEKNKLCALTPSTYTGLAETLSKHVKSIIQTIKE